MHQTSSNNLFHLHDLKSITLIMVFKDYHDYSYFVSFHQLALASEPNILINSISNSHKQNHLYRCLTCTEYDVLHDQNCISIPTCIVKHIHYIYPHDEGRYTGHCDVGEEIGSMIIKKKRMDTRMTMMEVMTVTSKN